ncbi:MAG: hypothetical protein A2W23_07170 [Planctomycetes bacterium RBG_16_43_13]|nr:MAG: hypothetical protein A2W23_07170 [Planctomycetes bacterium RBG_16_43_13]
MPASTNCCQINPAVDTMSAIFADSMKPPQIIIRKAATSDVPDIVKMWREMWEGHARLDPRFTTSGCANEIMEKWIDECIHSERALVLIAEDKTPDLQPTTLPASIKINSSGIPITRDNSIVGYILALILENPPVVTEQFYGYISDLSIVESHQKKGIGKMLLDEVQGWFKASKISYAEINVSVHNAAARGFWLRHGYTPFLDRMRAEVD